MSVDDLVARHIDPDAPPADWRLAVPWTGSGGLHQALSEAQLLEVGTLPDPLMCSAALSYWMLWRRLHQGLSEAQLLEMGALV